MKDQFGNNIVTTGMLIEYLKQFPEDTEIVDHKDNLPPDEVSDLFWFDENIDCLMY